MELVAASKMRKAVAATIKGRPYVRLSKETIEAVMEKSGNIEHELLRAGKGNRELAIVFTSDRGLAGGYNVNMIKFARDHIRVIENCDVIAVGKRGSDAMQRLQFQVVANFTGLGNAPQYQDIVPVARMALDGFTDGTYRRVHLFFTNYISGVTQTPVTQIVLPYGERGEESREKIGNEGSEYIMEPNPKLLLSEMIPRLVMTAFYQALLESSASEHAARMLAMKNASDSARDMMDSLTFTYNQVRQAAITQEIAEISSGKAALE
jgi:F-type H+-transporting ATPase subunit gamma